MVFKDASVHAVHNCSLCVYNLQLGRLHPVCEEDRERTFCVFTVVARVSVRALDSGTLVQMRGSTVGKHAVCVCERACVRECMCVFGGRGPCSSRHEGRGHCVGSSLKTRLYCTVGSPSSDGCICKSEAFLFFRSDGCICGVSGGARAEQLHEWCVC